eukprot:5465451-Heterocapsa_arctica.AAC.1
MPTRARTTHLYAIQADCAVVLAQVADSALANRLLLSRVASRPKPSSDTHAEARKASIERCGSTTAHRSAERHL